MKEHACSTYPPYSSSPQLISEEERVAWHSRGRRYAIRLLEHGATPPELFTSLTIATRELAVANLDAVLDAFDAPNVIGRRTERKRALLDGALFVAIAAGGLCIGADDSRRSTFVS